MKTFALLSTFLFVSSGFVLAESETAPQILTQAEADAVIESEMTVKADREADRRAELLEVPAVQEWTLDRLDQRTVFRHVAPPVHIAEPAEEEMVGKIEETEENSPAASERKSMNLTFFVRVFDDELTEIRVAPLADGITILSNVPFTHLPAIESVVMEDAYYSFFSFVDHVESVSEPSSDRPDSTAFSATGPEYLVFAEGDAEVSTDLLEAIDAIHRHYLKHEANFKSRAQRAAVLQAARERYLEENPSVPTERIINFHPVQSRYHDAGARREK